MIAGHDTPHAEVLIDPPRELHGRPILELRAPMPGWFVPSIGHGDLVTPGSVIGELHVLGRPIALVAARVRGIAMSLIEIDGSGTGSRAVGYRDLLFALDLEPALAGSGAGVAAIAAASTTGLVFCAPTSGRFYGRAAPDKPPFVTAGAELALGATVCLLEVMKTFHRVTYGGTGLPERARVRELLVADGADVNAGEPLLALEAV